MDASKLLLNLLLLVESFSSEESLASGEITENQHCRISTVTVNYGRKLSTNITTTMSVKPNVCHLICLTLQ